jgi:hypothetical protein
MMIDYSIVFLGDITDRGPESKRALELVEETISSRPSSSLILGNHDWFPIRILDELSGDHAAMALDHWIYNMGGGSTLLSYGFDPEGFTVADPDENFPRGHLDLLRNAVSHVELESHSRPCRARSGDLVGPTVETGHDADRRAISIVYGKLREDRRTRPHRDALAQVREGKNRIGIRHRSLRHGPPYCGSPASGRQH